MSEPDRPPQPLLVSLAALTVVSGFVDAVSYLGLGHVFTANMTGNVVLIGFAVAGAPGFSVPASLCALGVFLVGAVVGGRLARQVSPQRTLLLVAMMLEATFTAVAAVVVGTVPAIGSGWPRFTVIALLAFAMGVRNAAVRHFGVADMTTTVLTMTLTGLASDSSLAGGTNPHAGRRVAPPSACSAVRSSGAVLVIHVHPAWALGVAAGIVVCTAVYFAREAPARARPGESRAQDERPLGRRAQSRAPVLEVDALVGLRQSAAPTRRRSGPLSSRAPPRARPVAARTAPPPARRSTAASPSGRMPQSKRKRSPPGFEGLGRRKSTATSRPCSTTRPTSSCTSRRQASQGVSPSASMIPPGMVQCAL